MHWLNAFKIQNRNEQYGSGSRGNKTKEGNTPEELRVALLVVLENHASCDCQAGSPEHAAGYFLVRRTAINRPKMEMEIMKRCHCKNCKKCWRKGTKKYITREALYSEFLQFCEHDPHINVRQRVRQKHTELMMMNTKKLSKLQSNKA